MNTKLTGIAKDDAAYIAEWTFHHLYFGFDELEIIVTNSTDLTLSIIQKIAQTFPQIKIATQPSLLDMPSFTFELSQISNSGYTLKLNVDEFWLPIDFKSRVSAILHSKIEPHFLNLPCFQALEDNEFSILRRKISVEPIKKQCGLKFESSRSSDTDFILKRDMRSEVEYIAAKRDCLENFKVFSEEYHNGFKRPTNNALVMEFDEIAYVDYMDAYYSFLTLTGIKPLLKRARLEVFERAQQTVLQIIQLSKHVEEKEKSALLSLFSGIEDKNLKQALTKLDVNTYRESMKTSA
jgi:hypothetical protein